MGGGARARVPPPLCAPGGGGTAASPQIFECEEGAVRWPQNLPRYVPWCSKILFFLGFRLLDLVNYVGTYYSFF